MERICPKCGRPDTELGFVGEICIECALAGIREKWPTSLEYEKCLRCDKIRRGNDWKEAHPQLVGAIAEAAMKNIPGHYNLESQEWEGIWERGNDMCPFTHPMPIVEKRSVCPTCNRVASGYFEGIIQLRGKKKKVEKYAALLQKILSTKTFLPRVEEMHGGVDIYVGEKKDVAEVLFHQKLKYARSEKLSGEKKGRRLFRSTFLIRFDEEGEMEKGNITSGG